MGSGSAQLAELGRVLKVTGNGEMRRLLLRRLRETGKPIIADLRSEAHAVFGDAGGLAGEIADGKYAVRNRLSASGAGVRIVSINRRDLQALDAGRLRHPVFGHRPWVTQPIRAGWWTRTITADAPVAARKIREAVVDVKHMIEGAV